MIDVQVPSGAKVKISAGSWRETNDLRRAIYQQMALAGKNLSSDLDVLFLSVMVESSPVVYEAVFKCLERCTYNGQKITEAIFEDVSAREDYLPIVIACIECNLAPFLKTPVSKFLTFLGHLSPPESEAQALK